MKMNVKKVLIALGICLVLACCGCGDNQSGNGAQPSTGDKEQITLTFAHPGSTLDVEVLEARIALFEEQNPDIKIENQHITGDYLENYTTMFAGDSAADILWLAEGIHTFSSKGQLLPLNSYLEDAGVDLVQRNGKEYVEMYSYDGQIYGLPDRAGSMIVYYNKNLFDEAGIEYPNASWTWEDMLSAAKVLTKGEGENEQWGFGLEYWHPFWMNWCYQNGGKVVDEQGNIVINSSENIEALTFMQELLTVHDVVPSRTEIADFGSGATAATIFAQGRMGFIMNGLWTVAALQDVDFDWGIAEMWGEKENVTCPFGSVLSISSACKNPEAAFRFLNFMSGVDSQELIVEYKQDVPANLEVRNSELFTNAKWTGKPIDLDIFNRQPVYALPMTSEWIAWNTIWSDELAGVYDGTTDPAKALENIETKMKQ
ncbi:extracellular solute-binding protein [Eisenbergiella sp.]